MNKKALLICDDPFVEIISGTCNRVITILEELKKLNISIDQLIKYKKYSDINANKGEFIDNVILLKKSKIPLFKKLIVKFKNNRKLTKREKEFFKQLKIKTYKLDFLIEDLKKQVDVDKYDYVISVNSNNAFWIDAFGEKTKKILLMEDVLFNQFRDLGKKELVDKFLDDYKNYEAKLVNKFDKIIGISQEEINVFKNNTNKDKFVYIPAFMKSKNISIDKDYKYDILYVAHDNMHNVNAVRWFLDNVYQYLQDEKILFVGKICDVIVDKSKYKNINFISYAKELEDVYNNSKISICPMFSGTGLKIKIVEAFAYGKPVVCNKMGLVGQPDLKNFPGFVSDDPKEFADYIKKLLKDKELYEKYSNNALEYFNKYFSYEKNIKKLIDVFSE